MLSTDTEANNRVLPTARVNEKKNARDFECMRFVLLHFEEKNHRK